MSRPEDAAHSAEWAGPGMDPGYVEWLFSAKAFPTKKDAGVNVVNHILIIFFIRKY